MKQSWKQLALRSESSILAILTPHNLYKCCVIDWKFEKERRIILEWTAKNTMHLNIFRSVWLL